MTAVDTKDCKIFGTGDRREFIYIFLLHFFFLPLTRIAPSQQPFESQIASNRRRLFELPSAGEEPLEAP